MSGCMRDEFASVSEAVYTGRCDHRVVRRLTNGLKYISDSCELRAEIFRHPLGFIEVPIWKMFELPHKPHIHIWKFDEDFVAKKNIHYHSVDISSYVAVGTLTDVLYTASEEPPFTHASYQVEFGDYGSRRVRDGRFYRVEERERRELVSGDIYSVPASVFHDTLIDPQAWPVTFMVSYNPLPIPHVALGDLEERDVIHYAHVNDLSERALIDVLGQSVARIEGGNSA